MTTARMDDILRQKNPELKAAVLSVLAGDPAEAVEMLGAGVHEVEYDDLGTRAAEAWLRRSIPRPATGRCCWRRPMRCGRRSTRRCARRWPKRGVLRGRTLTIERLVNLGMTRAEKGEVRNYREDDIVVFNQDLLNSGSGRTTCSR